MTARRHPGGHLRVLHKRTKLRILKHKIGGHDHAIRSISRRRRSIVEPRDGLLQRALDAVRGDDEIGIKHFARRERDVQATQDGRIGLNTARTGCAEADTHAGCAARELNKYVRPVFNEGSGVGEGS